MGKNRKLRKGVSNFIWAVLVFIVLMLLTLISRLSNHTSSKISSLSEFGENTAIGINGGLSNNTTHLGSSIKNEPKSRRLTDTPVQSTSSHPDPVEYLEFTQRSGREAFVEIFSILIKHDPCRKNIDLALTLTALTYADLWDANDLFKKHWKHIVETEITFQLQELSPGVKEPDISVNRDHILNHIEDLEVARRKREIVIRRILNVGVALSDEELIAILKTRPNQSLNINDFTRFEGVEWYDTNHFVFRSESRDSGNVIESEKTQPTAVPWNTFRSQTGTRVVKP